MENESFYEAPLFDGPNAERGIKNLARNLVNNVRNMAQSNNPALQRAAHEWLNADPQTTPPDQMPAVSPQQVMELLKISREMLVTHVTQPLQQATRGMGR
ncbi:hypothetical protein A4U49_04375 [Acidithiobacillus ferrivorans]|uniref:hypothetical protein n=1 Tax=Acidithiobacillus ferrivorans TaxID=160808 RepID=UPI000892B1C2|nr:hypothetical protein [Acidithiobacillus ferrivorans]OFA17023.1 hypothetical protein A4U49_04375 [Acidithiobacillus ferrivorans]